MRLFVLAYFLTEFILFRLFFINPFYAYFPVLTHNKLESENKPENGAYENKTKKISS